MTQKSGNAMCKKCLVLWFQFVSKVMLARNIYVSLEGKEIQLLFRIAFAPQFMEFVKDPAA